MIDRHVVLEPLRVPRSGELRPVYQTDIDYSLPVDLFPKWSEVNQRYYLIAHQKYHRNEIAAHVPRFWEFVTIHDAVAESG